ncbi:PREDICTED: uncharacterized protein LOC105126932 [Populus euphratica]|uniref:Uncharacterized protein LOC105126932 n=1 Tax=Populus euphratica TaxID=75702 RepID=A0AAJ6UAG2_POPEU|nr:PREDICTED: uncharacterized protein LOC105126932 [Populus euphratica]XP_011026283.1 PREDICTED: uncharacterized protein LOC105126932 [Populus euphratica]
MQCTTTTYVAPLPSCPMPSSLHSHLHRSHLRIVKSTCLYSSQHQTHSKNICSLTLHTTSNCKRNGKEQKNSQTNNNKGYPDPDQNLSVFDRFQCSLDNNTNANQNPETENQEIEETGDTETGNQRRLLSNTWWTDLRAALGQRINVEGIVSSASVFVKDRHLALPHVVVPDIRYIDWGGLQARGFKGVVFDKDNTITVPYSLTLWGPLGPSIERCKSVFGNDIAVFSNSAGLFEYDHDGSKARALEKAIGIKVIRHRVKKPAGTSEEIEKHFGCKSSRLIMVGDRPFTDIVYGNRNGFLTVLTKPLSLAEEPFIVRQVRKLETSLMGYWFKRGLKPISHNLLPDAMQCVKDPPLQ